MTRVRDHRHATARRSATHLSAAAASLRSRVGALGLVVALGCGKDAAPERSASAEPAGAAPAAATAAAPQGQPAAPTAQQAAASPEGVATAPDRVGARETMAEHDGQLVRRIAEAYERVRLDLYEGEFAAAKRHAIDVGSIASERRDGVYREMVDAARFVTQQRSIDGSRQAFEALSRTLWAVVADTPVVAGASRGFVCPGVGHQRWLQIGPSVPGNPYRGRDADACADEVPLSR